MNDELNSRNSYGSILKSIGLFGGVKVFQILVNIIKNKVIAVLLGPVGMGIAGLLTSTTNMINAACGCGLHTSSVRDIAKAYQSGDEDRIGIITTVLRTLVIITGIVGMLITFFLAPCLSNWSFGNGDYTSAFRIISVILLFDQLCVGQTALMQGSFHYRYMAKSALWGSVLGLVVSIPLYFIWHLKAIAPVIVLSSLMHLSLSWFYSHKIKCLKKELSVKLLWDEGKGMIILGLAIALAGFVGTGKTYVLRSFISRYGSVSDVGLYTAGIAIATQYIDVILRSMGSDYSPRLAAVSDDRLLFVNTINRQLKLLTTIVTPLIIPFVVLIKELTLLLYSSSFLGIIGMMEWIMVGMFFRTTSWCLSYAIVAKGESQKFFLNETISNLYSLLFSAVGYVLYSFTGMGIAFCISYVIYTLQMLILCKRSFSYSVSLSVVSTLMRLFIPLVASFIIIKLVGYSPIRYLLGFLISLLIAINSYGILNEMVPVKETITRYTRSFMKKQNKND